MPPPAAIGSSSGKGSNRCPACGQPLGELVRGRCPLCDYQVEEESVTAPDTTPFAENECQGRREWWTMTKYIWAAGDGRLSHLSLMRASPASRRYARRTLYPVVAAGAICWFALTGWHDVKAISVEAGGQARQPSGGGWCALARSPLEIGDATSNPSRIVAWWWNPPLAVLGSLAALLWGYVLCQLLLAIVRAGVERSLLPRYRGQQRLSAAVYYAVAWSVPLVPAGLILVLLPLCRLAEVGDWLIRPPTASVYVPAAVLGGFAVFMGWFGLVRLAATVPVRARTRVFLFCGLWMPLIAAVLIAGSIWGLWWLQQTIAAELQLQW